MIRLVTSLGNMLNSISICLVSNVHKIAKIVTLMICEASSYYAGSPKQNRLAQQLLGLDVALTISTDISRSTDIVTATYRSV